VRCERAAPAAHTAPQAKAPSFVATDRCMDVPAWAICRKAGGHAFDRPERRDDGKRALAQVRLRCER